ncbi:PLDc N-terminal domain-containing protein [Arthrobacter sp. CG_A4]|uniref:PLDc N-terminal domain-containing protein n=1 Tax=Arthrobacter sp. CG_A4 TaxID=3071706 RepID=UPI002DFE2E21|nr:hypothetical protein [Arthrobacter sp. CG_A4]
MGHELIVALQIQEASTQPNYWLLAVTAIPTIILAVVVLVTLVLALTDPGLTILPRLAWGILIVAVPLLGAIIYLVLRGRQRIPWPKNGVANKG